MACWCFVSPENIQYSDAAYYWNPKDLVANTFKVLWQHTYNDNVESIRATQDVTMPDANTVDLTGDSAYIILGIKQEWTCYVTYRS